MIKQLFKIVWNRKKANFLIMMEVLISFLVVFLVMVSSIYFTDIYMYPLGYSYKDVWAVQIDTGAYNPEADKLKEQEIAKKIMQAAKDFPEVEALAGINVIPFDNNEWRTGFEFAGKSYSPAINYVTDELPEVLDIKLLEGRWFNKEDDAISETPVVINQALSRELYGSESAVGKVFESGLKSKKVYKVVGLVSDFRDDGELAELKSYMFQRNNLSSTDTEKMLLVDHFIIKLRPGTPAALEEKLVKTFTSIAKDWSFNIEALEDIRYKRMKSTLTPILTASIVAVFLMIMVALGLSGVLWQSVTQRIKEIGLRRAKGATQGKIYYQILGELLVITSIALFVGTIIVIQIPLLGFLNFVSIKVYVITLLISWAIIALLTVICGLYPSSIAANIPPAEALHYE
ncbi:MAG: ABC transporter permease [Acidobacteria bacterium]|nr:ABC transporter permease [Acidobacteriota bacterium]